MPTDQLQRALVTGASSGIGAEFARALAARRLDLVLVARRAERLEELAAELSSTHGVEVEVLVADLVDDQQRGTVEDRLARVDRPVDLVINNAGYGAYGSFATMDLDRQSMMVDLNVTALVRLTRVALPGMLARGKGGVINVASVEASQPAPYGAVYAASKAFVRSFSEAVHEEVRSSPVRVMALCPGFTTTEFQDVADVVSASMPGSGAMAVGPVVEQALTAFARGRAVCVPGASNKVSTAMSAMSPSTITRKVSGLLHQRVIGDQGPSHGDR